MSRHRNCWDNAPQESFFLPYGGDHVDHRNCQSLSEIQHEIKQYIHYYNYQRYQWIEKR
nr:IS3 family transposase [Paenibacillus azoreducens]